MKALVTVELPLCSDLLFPLCSLDRIEDQVNILFLAGFVRNDTVVIQVTDHGKNRKPCPVQIYEMSVAHFWFGLSTAKFLFSRLG